MSGGFPPIKYYEINKKDEKKKDKKREYQSNIKKNISIRQILNTKKISIIDLDNKKKEELEIV